MANGKFVFFYKLKVFFDNYEIINGKMDDVFLAATGKRPGGEEK